MLEDTDLVTTMKSIRFIWIDYVRRTWSKIIEEVTRCEYLGTEDLLAIQNNDELLESRKIQSRRYDMFRNEY